jgi:hypothetical protein
MTAIAGHPCESAWGPDADRHANIFDPVRTGRRHCAERTFGVSFKIDEGTIAAFPTRAVEISIRTT